MFREYKTRLLELAPPHRAGAKDIFTCYQEIKTQMRQDLLDQNDNPPLQIGDLKKTKLQNKIYLWVRNVLIREGSNDKEERGE